MSVESFRDRPDIVSSIAERNITDKAKGFAFSRYVSLGLQLKEEGTSELRFRKEISEKEGKNRALNHGAIILGISLRALEKALMDGTFDAYETVSWYNEAVIGTLFQSIPEPANRNLETVPEEKLARMREFANKDKTLAIFFMDNEAFKTLPSGLLSFIAAKNTGLKLAADVYFELSKLLPNLSILPKVFQVTDGDWNRFKSTLNPETS